MFYPVYRDRHGTMWIGAWLSRLSRFADGRFINYTVRDGLASDVTSAIGEDQ